MNSYNLGALVYVYLSKDKRDIRENNKQFDQDDTRIVVTILGVKLNDTTHVVDEYVIAVPEIASCGWPFERSYLHCIQKWKIVTPWPIGTKGWYIEPSGILGPFVKDRCKICNGNSL